MLIAVVTLALTNAWNPWPGVWAWVMRTEPIANGVASWEQQLGGSAETVTIAGNAVVVEYRTRVEAFGSGAAHFDRAEDLVAGVAGKSILVKGSRFMKMERVVAALMGGH